MIFSMLKKTLVFGLITTILSKPVLSESSSIEVEPSKACSRTISFVLEEIQRHGGENAALYRYTSDANEGYYGNPTVDTPTSKLGDSCLNAS
jgi:hypothetical protein